MELYYSPGACSLAVHIIAREAGIPLRLEKVDLGTHRTESGQDFTAINPKGYVPAVKFDGEIMTEVAAIAQFLADKEPQSGLAPSSGTMARYRLQEWLTFISSEIHKGFSPLWNSTAPDTTKQAAKDRLAVRFAYLDKALAGRPFLTGSQFTIADAYLFTVVNWVNFLGIDISAHRNLKAFLDRIAQRPKVQEALVAEGLIEKAA
jgi:glutathione S-transferase